MPAPKTCDGVREARTLIFDYCTEWFIAACETSGCCQRAKDESFSCSKKLIIWKNIRFPQLDFLLYSTRCLGSGRFCLLESQAVVKDITQSCRMAKILIEHLRKILADCLMLRIVFRCGSYYINIYYLKLNFNETSPLKIFAGSCTQRNVQDKGEVRVCDWK